jgi:hypothetical protein
MCIGVGQGIATIVERIDGEEAVEQARAHAGAREG